MPNPNRPYSKINFRSRKEKDRRNIAAAQSAPYGGDVIIKSKQKIANPANKAQMLPRGAQVSFRNVNETVKNPDATVPAKKYTTSTTIPAQKKFVAGDYNPPGKPTVDRPTTMALGKQLKESPAKTQARMDAQKAEKPTYEYKGKKEYSGRSEVIPAKTVTQEKTTPALTMKGESYTVPKKQVITKSVVSRPDQGLTRKSTAKHVPWLADKKETKGLTTKPNTGGKTTTIWKKSPNKIKRN